MFACGQPFFSLTFNSVFVFYLCMVLSQYNENRNRMYIRFYTLYGFDGFLAIYFFSHPSPVKMVAADSSVFLDFFYLLCTFTFFVLSIFLQLYKTNTFFFNKVGGRTKKCRALRRNTVYSLSRVFSRSGHLNSLKLLKATSR